MKNIDKDDVAAIAILTKAYLLNSTGPIYTKIGRAADKVLISATNHLAGRTDVENNTVEALEKVLGGGAE